MASLRPGHRAHPMEMTNTEAVVEVEALMAVVVDPMRSHLFVYCNNTFS